MAYGNHEWKTLRTSSSQLPGDMKIFHPRSEGNIDGGAYIKKSAKSLVDEADELARCMHLSIRTEHVIPLRFLKYDAKENVLCTEYINGESFFNSLWNSTSSLNRLITKDPSWRSQLSRVEEIGQWLFRYHRSWEGTGSLSDAASWLTESFQRKVKKIYEAKLVDKLTEKELLGFQEKFTEHIKRNGNIDICRIHGDFISYNMLLDQHGFVHIGDFGDTRIGLVLEDVARFWENIWSVARARQRKSQAYLEAGEVFLKGYGLDNSIVSDESFVFLRVYNAITNLAGFEFAKRYLGWRSKLITKKMTAASMRWVKCTINSH